MDGCRIEAGNYTIAIVLCKNKNSALVEITYPRMPIFIPGSTNSTSPARNDCKKSWWNGWQITTGGMGRVRGCGRKLAHNLRSGRLSSCDAISAICS